MTEALRGRPTAAPQATIAADPGRLARFLTALLLGLYVLFGYGVVTQTHHGVGPGGTPLFYDFAAFYQAGAFADAGHAAAAYDDDAMIAAEHAAFPGSTSRLPWNYPPLFQLALMPLAALPYLVAWLVWSGAVCVFYGLTARQLFEPRRLWPMVLAPGMAVNLLVGQNGLLSTALIGAGVLLLPRRPIVAGVVLGLLAYKPQIAVLAPLVLLFGREWRALSAAVVSETVLILLSAAVLGVDPWIAFVHKMSEPAALFTSSSSNWRAIPSVMVFAHSLGLAPGISSALHWATAAAAAAGALWIWNRHKDVRLRAGALAAAALLVTPYLRAYDLALLILPIAALLPRDGERSGIGLWALIAAAWVAPAVVLMTTPQVQCGALVTAAVMALIVSRAARPPSRQVGAEGDHPPQPA